MRSDFKIVQQWISPRSRILDLGCGDGTLLAFLQEQKQVQGYGLEIEPGNITACLDKGLNVLEQNLDGDLSNFQDHSFDTVIMTQALQVLRYPHHVLDEMLRIGRECIITFPNFGHWRCRVHLALKGRMPVSKFMPHTWYDTPNIHFCTFRDFELLCQEKQLKILNRMVVDQFHRGHMINRLLPNLFGEVAIYHLSH